MVQMEERQPIKARHSAVTTMSKRVAPHGKTLGAFINDASLLSYPKGKGAGVFIQQLLRLLPGVLIPWNVWPPCIEQVPASVTLEKAYGQKTTIKIS